MKNSNAVQAIIVTGSLLVQLTTLCFHSHAAAGDLDLSFDPGLGVNRAVRSMALQPDGKLLIGDVFTFINGTNRYGRSRLNADGALDTAFVSDSFAPNLATIVYGSCPPYNYCDDSYYNAMAAAVQPDGKVLVSGSYFHLAYDGEGFINEEYALYRLARFNANGTWDGSFHPFDDYYGNASVLAFQPDGKILVGVFANAHISRFNSNGVWDTNFNVSTTAYDDQSASFTNAPVFSAVVQADGKVLIGGSFTRVNGTDRNHIARVNSNGSLDSSFNPGTGANGSIYSVVVQSNGQVLIGGSFTAVNGTNRNRIARLNSNGTLDNTFNPGTGPDDVVRSIALQPDGNVLIGGDFRAVNGTMRLYVARLYGADVSPDLRIGRENGLITISWPTTAGFVLDQSLTTTGIWSQVALPYNINGTSVFVNTTASTGNKFYRLRKP